MEYNKCNLCPRGCNVNREENTGVCRVSSTLKVARAALHYWEEPCISGENGSGAVFFSGCNLHCIFCQNQEIQEGKLGKDISVERLVKIFFELKEQGANNINLVTATHYIPSVSRAIQLAKTQGFDLPFVYNTSGYETVESLRRLDGLIDIYLPDFKYWDEKLSMSYSKAGDYPQVVKAAIDEMIRQCPSCEFDENGLMTNGVIVRHLLLPGHVNDAKQICQYLYDRYGSQIYISVMSQYTPMKQVANHEELNRKVTKREYNRLLDFIINQGMEQVFIQEGQVADESFIPDFNLTGV